MVIKVILLIPYPPSLKIIFQKTNSEIELPFSQIMVLKEPPRNPRFFHESHQFFVFLTQEGIDQRFFDFAMSKNQNQGLLTNSNSRNVTPVVRCALYINWFSFVLYFGDYIFNSCCRLNPGGLTVSNNIMVTLSIHWRKTHLFNM